MAYSDGAGPVCSRRRGARLSDVDPRLVAALTAQLRARRGGRVGWKLGIGDRERIGNELAVGHLTTATQLEPGATYSVGDAARLHADAEIAVEIGADEEIVGFAAALELVDLDNAPHSAEDVVAANIFHRAFALGRAAKPELPPRIEARLLVNGDVRASGEAPTTLGDRIERAALILHAVGERLEPGDRVITGSVVQVAVRRGDHVSADFGPLGRVGLELA
jgi:2-keto-4-pentenoate hydratase